MNCVHECFAGETAEMAGPNVDIVMVVCWKLNHTSSTHFLEMQPMLQHGRSLLMISEGPFSNDPDKAAWSDNSSVDATPPDAVQADTPKATKHRCHELLYHEKGCEDTLLTQAIKLLT